MTAQVPSPIRAFILSFAFFAGLFNFIPYTPSRPNFSFTKRRAHSPIAAETSKDSSLVRIPHILLAHLQPDCPLTVRLRRPELISSEFSPMTLSREGLRVRQATGIVPDIATCHENSRGGTVFLACDASLQMPGYLGLGESFALTTSPRILGKGPSRQG